MVVPLGRRATKSPAQRTSEGRVSEEMAADSLSFQPIRRFPRRYNEIRPYHRDLMKCAG